MFFIGISISITGIILIILSLSTRTIYTKRKQSYSQNWSNLFSNINGNKYIPNETRIPLENDDDDEELIHFDISSNFGENNSIELRLEQDFDENDN